MSRSHYARRRKYSSFRLGERNTSQVEREDALVDTLKLYWLAKENECIFTLRAARLIDRLRDVNSGLLAACEAAINQVHPLISPELFEQIESAVSKARGIKLKGINDTRDV